MAIRDHPTRVRLVREDQASSFVGPLRSGIILCQSMAISDRPLSVREDQSSSVVIHGQSVAIQYHPMSVREDQSSSFVSLHHGMRLPDKQTRYRQADKQDNKEDYKVSGFGCSEAPSSRACCTLDCLFGASAVFPPRSVALRFRLHRE